MNTDIAEKVELNPLRNAARFQVGQSILSWIKSEDVKQVNMLSTPAGGWSSEHVIDTVIRSSLNGSTPALQYYGVEIDPGTFVRAQSNMLINAQLYKGDIYDAWSGKVKWCDGVGIAAPLAETDAVTFNLVWADQYVGTSKKSILDFAWHTRLVPDGGVAFITLGCHIRNPQCRAYIEKGLGIESGLAGHELNRRAVIKAVMSANTAPEITTTRKVQLVLDVTYTGAGMSTPMQILGFAFGCKTELPVIKHDYTAGRIGSNIKRAAVKAVNVKRVVKPSHVNTSKYVIESAIPVPERRNAAKYPFASMKVGDSFVCGTNSIRSSVDCYSKKYAPTNKYVVRKEVAGRYRIWRVE